MARGGVPLRKHRISRQHLAQCLKTYLKTDQNIRTGIQNNFFWPFGPLFGLRACLHGGGGPQIGDVARLDEVTRMSI